MIADPMHWKADQVDHLLSKWGGWGLSVPGRDEGRKPHHTEAFMLRHSIRELLVHLNINGSFEIFHFSDKDSPDFQIVSDEKEHWIECTEACFENDGQWLSRDHSGGSLFPNPKIAGIEWKGWNGDAAEQNLLEAVRYALEKKAKIARKRPLRVILVIFLNGNFDAFLDDKKCIDLIGTVDIPDCFSGVLFMRGDRVLTVKALGRRA